MDMDANVIFETKRLTLRKCTPEDLAFFEEMLGDAETMRFFGQGKPLSSAEAEAWLDSCIRHCQRHGWGPGMLVRKVDGAVVGLGVLTYMQHDPTSEEGDLIFVVRKSHWGQGYATEFARAATAYMLKHTTIKRVIATAMPENRASNRVLVKAGLRFTGYDSESNRNCYIAKIEDLG
ncbi:MAG: GNAT family N-acetyltransferase [Chloroflexota bacterium]|nr:GNAT family N-acetyltransferase [Chloroflexota bacterium]MDE2841452.1 GNAT family N-acetyltransferase [Chloroflexota bacterium]MDE2929437.1 GNAT family N-acetyltransferase [Chloroflexota bacterium]